MQQHVVSQGSLTFNVCFTDASDGDFQIDSPSERLMESRRRIVDFQWSWVRQVHGAEVIEISQPVGFAGVADGLVTSALHTPISVSTADCMPLVLIGSSSIAVVHAGWRGLVAGVVDQAVQKLRARSESIKSVLLGPHIHVAEYEFSEPELSLAANALGNEVVGVTSEGNPALDLFRGLENVCRRNEIPVPPEAESTSGDNFFSHRLSTDAGRQATVAWIS